MTATSPVLPLPTPLPDGPPESLEKIAAGSAGIDPGFGALLAHLLSPRAAVGQATLPVALVTSGSPALEDPAPELPDPGGPGAAPVQPPPAQTALTALLLTMALVPAPPLPVSPPTPELPASERRPSPNGRPALPSAVEAAIMNSTISPITNIEPAEIRGSTVPPVTGSDRTGSAPAVGPIASDGLRPAVVAEVVEAPPDGAAPDAVLPPAPDRAPTPRREAAPPVSTEPVLDIVRLRDPEPEAARVSATVAPPSPVDAGDSGSSAPGPAPHPSVAARALISAPRAPEDREPVTAVHAGGHVEPVTPVHVEAAAATPPGVHADSDTTTGNGTEQGRDPETRRDPGPSLTEEAAGVAPPAPRAGAVEETTGPEITAASRSVVRQVVAGIGRLRAEGRHEVSLRLDPPELGAVRIEAVLTGSRLTLQIHASMPATRDALEQALPRLRESLAEHGIVPSQVTVNLGLDGSSRRFGGEGFGAPAPPAPAWVAPARTASPGRWSQTRPDGVDLWV